MRTVPIRVPQAMATALLAVAVLATACGETGTEPGTTYHLRTFNGRALPTSLSTLPSADEALQLVEGSIRFLDDGRVVQHTLFACADPLPPNTTCEVDPEGLRRTGTFYPDSGIVRFPDGIRGRATFDGEDVLVQFGTLPDDRYPTAGGTSFWFYAR